MPVMFVQLILHGKNISTFVLVVIVNIKKKRKKHRSCLLSILYMKMPALSDEAVGKI